MSLEDLFQSCKRTKLQFVRSIVEAANNSANLPFLENRNILGELQPFINDPSPLIEQYAILAMGRVIHQSPNLAWEAINMNILPVILNDIQHKNVQQKNSIFFLLRAICKHDTKLAQTVLNHYGVLDAIVISLQNADVTVRQSVAWVVDYIARHNELLARACADNGLVPLLVVCMYEAGLNLNRIACGALADIAKHSQDLAECVAEAGGILAFKHALNQPDIKLQRVAVIGLVACAKHSSDLTRAMLNIILPSTFLCLIRQCVNLQRNACVLIRDMVKHAYSFAKHMVGIGVVGVFVDILNQPIDENKQPVITALGYIASYSGKLTMAILNSGMVSILAHILEVHTSDAILAATAWTLGQIGQHTVDHAQVVAATNIFPRLLQLHLSHISSNRLRSKCAMALKMCLRKCLLVSALESLVFDAPTPILRYVLRQYAKILPHDLEARRQFVRSGCLKHLQNIEADPNGPLTMSMRIINLCFPEDVRQYYSADYLDTLLDKVERYSPQVMIILNEPQVIDGDTEMKIKEMFE